MNLLNKQVIHQVFGKGNVVNYTDSVIEIHFSSGNKRFVYPQAFKTHLTLTDKRAAVFVQTLKEKMEKEQLEKELELQMIKAMKDKERKRVIERENLMRNHKLFHNSQAVFWCDKQEQDKVFTEWRVFTGMKKSGANKGQPNRLIRIYQNTACLITERDPDMPEKDRRITGVYMVNDTFIGKLCEDGYISADPEYRLRLSEEESEKMLFWNYYANEMYQHKLTWNSGKYRYFDNVLMAQILRDIISLKKGQEERELVQQFFEYFCLMNRIAEDEVPKTHDGALMRI